MKSDEDSHQIVSQNVNSGGGGANLVQYTSLECYPYNVLIKNATTYKPVYSVIRTDRKDS